MRCISIAHEPSPPSLTVVFCFVCFFGSSPAHVFPHYFPSCVSFHAELRIFSVAWSSVDVVSHMAGNFFGVTASQQLLWLKFDDAVYSSGIVDSSGTAISAVSMVSTSGTTTTRNGPGDSGKCLRGWWSGFSLSRESAASVAVGTQSVYTIYQMDNCQHTQAQMQEQQRCPPAQLLC
jgi:hypothetical protein